MRVPAGILGIVFGIVSLGWAAWANAVGMGESFLGSLGIGSMQTDGSEIQFLSWSAPILALTGAGFTFAWPEIGAAVMGLSVLCFWSLLGFKVISEFFSGPVIGLSFSILLAAGMAAFATSEAKPFEANGERSRLDPHSSDEVQQPLIHPPAASAQAAPAFNRARWNSLLEYDNEIAAAAAKVRPFGKRWEDELGYSFLALNDKSYLPEIVEKLSSRAREEAEQLAIRARGEMEEAERLRALNEKRIEERQKALEKAAQQRKERRAKIIEVIWGTAFRKILLVSNLILIASVSGILIYQATRGYQADIVWSPSENIKLQTLRSNCQQFICLTNEMERAGASQSSVAFSEALNKFNSEYIGYASKFFAYGSVDVVQVTFPWSGQQGSFGYFFVNGHPSIVDGFGWNVLNSVDLTQDQTFQAIKSNNQSVGLWRPETFLSHAVTGSGDNEFVMALELHSCGACNLLGYAMYAFDFDQDGHYRGVTGSASYELPQSINSDTQPFSEDEEAAAHSPHPSASTETQTPPPASVSVPAPTVESQNPQPSNAQPTPTSSAPSTQAGQTITGHVDSMSAAGWPVIAGQELPLFGIDGIAPSSRSGFASWLSSLGNKLVCTPSPSNPSANLYQCRTPEGVDIAEGAILNGAGRATPDAPQLYQDAQQQASAAKRGIWQ